MRNLYKGKIGGAAALMLLVTALTGCQGDVTFDNVGDKISESVSDTITKTKKQVSDEIKSALADEVQAFLKSDDLEYIDNYEFDEEQLRAAKESVEEFLEGAKGLSTEEIKKNIADIFEENKE